MGRRKVGDPIGWKIEKGEAGAAAVQHFWTCLHAGAKASCGRQVATITALRRPKSPLLTSACAECEAREIVPPYLLRRCRLARGLTLRQAAGRLGSTAGRLHDYERGYITRPDALFVQRLCELYVLTVGQVLRDIGGAHGS